MSGTLQLIQSPDSSNSLSGLITLQKSLPIGLTNSFCKRGAGRIRSASFIGSMDSEDQSGGNELLALVVVVNFLEDETPNTAALDYHADPVHR